MVERTEQKGPPTAFRGTLISVTEEQVEGAKNGDQYAFAAIDEELRPRMERYFHSRLPEEADDLTQETIIRISRGLTRFSPRGERPYAQQFTLWSFAIAKTTLNEELRRMIRRREMFLTLPPDATRETEDNSDDVLSRLAYRSNMLPSEESITEDELRGRQVSPADPNKGTDLLKGWFRENLTERQRLIVGQRLDDKKNGEIAASLGLSEALVDKEVLTVRRSLEKEVLFPAGFRHVYEFVDDKVEDLGRDQIETGVQRGQLEAVKILGKYYTNPELIQEYMLRKRKSQQEVRFSEGLLNLGLHVTPSEHALLLRNFRYREMLVFHNGKAFIRQEDLEKFKENTRSKEQPSGVVSNEDKKERLLDIVSTKVGYDRIIKAIRKGAIGAEKVDGVWVTTKAAIRRYDEEVSRKRLIRTKLSPQI